MKRRGFSLIELVIAIVVISIALMSVPMIINQGVNNNQFALMQESILASHTKMGNIISYKWDQNSLDEQGTIARVLDVSAVGDTELERFSDRRRIGHVEYDYRRRMFNDETNASVVGQDVAGIFDDIDDFDGDISTVAGAANGAFDYLDEDLQLKTRILYVSDGADYTSTDLDFVFNVTGVAGSSNIKMVEINASSKNNDTNFLFRTFSSNIGQNKLFEAVIQ